MKVIPDKNLSKLNNVINNGVKKYERYKFKKFQPHISLATGIDKEKFYKILGDHKDFKMKLRFKLKYIYAGTRKNGHQQN